ncbi:AAA family ATPase [Aeromonas hydrophila]|uniref:AAA family ATPase n=1 Tax=Aeromonas hydrophila TaxID=644 RepID=UPI002B4897EB|nr:AAA family ATPase [Aeromonas hydrophila]
MQLKMEGNKAHNGFQLQTPTILNESILVLTGKNGSGKTRLLESIANRSVSIYINDIEIENKDISLVSHASLNPNFGSNYNDTQYNNRITSTLHLYDQIKNDLQHPFDPMKYTNHRSLIDGPLDYESLFKLCVSISKRIGKPAHDLSHEDISLYFEEPNRNLLGIQNVSTIVNQYIKRKQRNEFNEWRNKEKGYDFKFLSEEDFIRQFGDKPWILINRIIEDTFDGKFLFNSPDETSQSYTYQAQLLQSKEQKPVPIEHLSSGEKTLLWLAITLFNSQYYNHDIVNTPKILLIDEPDAFLHPKMVLKMYQVFKSFNYHFNSVVIISTHSPTTVALAPSEIIYLVDDNSIELIEKDRAISELLDGVSQISLNPKNRRQVYVESQYDAEVYQCIFSHIAHTSNVVDPKITLNFISSGPKLPKQQIIDKATQILDINDMHLLDEFATSLIGVGNCVQVIGQVDALVENEHDTVRGIIDWDLKNKPSAHISILAKGYAYSIENITLDPICILLLLHIDYSETYSIYDICGSNVSWRDWLQDEELLQESVDRYILKVLDRENNKDSHLKYISEVILLTDREYLEMNGHKLEMLVKNKYPQLRSYCRKGRDGELKITIVNKSMISLTGGEYIPKVYEEVLASVQK